MVVSESVKFVVENSVANVVICVFVGMVLNSPNPEDSSPDPSSMKKSPGTVKVVEGISVEDEVVSSLVSVVIVSTVVSVLVVEITAVVSPEPNCEY